MYKRQPQIDAQKREVRSYKYTNANLVPEDVQCVLVVGGDGTLLQACRDLVEREIPLLGINLGTLGYLAEIDRQNIFPALDKLVLDEYVVERRMMLEGKAMRMGKHLMQDLALNDIVIGREGRLRVIDFKDVYKRQLWRKAWYRWMWDSTSHTDTA